MLNEWQGRRYAITLVSKFSSIWMKLEVDNEMLENVSPRSIDLEHQVIYSFSRTKFAEIYIKYAKFIQTFQAFLFVEITSIY